MVKKVEHERYWKHLDLRYLTEESDDPENPNGIVEHKIMWHSESHSFLFHLFFYFLSFQYRIK